MRFNILIKFKEKVVEYQISSDEEEEDSDQEVSDYSSDEEAQEEGEEEEPSRGKKGKLPQGKRTFEQRSKGHGNGKGRMSRSSQSVQRSKGMRSSKKDKTGSKNKDEKTQPTITTTDSAVLDFSQSNRKYSKEKILLGMYFI